MLQNPYYYQWSIHLLYWVGGVATTVAGSWVSSKIRDYQEARNHHRDDIKEHVLRPLRSKIEAMQLLPTFSVEWFQQNRNPTASAQEPPVTYGHVLSMNEPDPDSGNPIEQALLEDARVNHYVDLIASWNKLKESWFVHLDRRATWVESIADAVSNGCNLEAYPTKEVNAPYVMHLALAMFVYNRLVGLGEAILDLQIEPSMAYLICGAQRVAMGEPGQMRQLVSLVDSLIAFHMSRATQLHLELTKLTAGRSSVLRRFSLAIAEKKLSHRCALVPFF